MLRVRKQTSTDKKECRYSITLFRLVQFALTYHVLRGNHLDITLGIGPIDITFGTTVWGGCLRG